MNDWQLYAAIYLGVGFVVCLVVVAAHLIGRRKKSKFVRDMMNAVNPRREAFLYRVLEDLVVPALAFFLVWLVWPVVFVLKIRDSLKKKALAAQTEQEAEPPAFALNDSELLRQVTVDEVERTNLIHDPLEAVPNIPFGHCHARWVLFRDSLQANETLWEFESTRSELAGVQAMWGYAVRGEGKVDRFMTSGWKLRVGVFEST
jgi:hypothetical protein